MGSQALPGREPKATATNNPVGTAMSTPATLLGEIRHSGSFRKSNQSTGLNFVACFAMHDMKEH
jgi:hypothetical protein